MTNNEDVFTLSYQERDGRPVTKWIENPDNVLKDTPQDKVGKVSREWPKDLVVGLQTRGELCDVLHAPEAFIFLPRGREKVERSRVADGLIEWLPIEVRGLGECYVCHPCEFIPYQERSIAKMDPILGIIGGVSKYIFDEGIKLPPIFLMANPSLSRAGRKGYDLGYIFLTPIGREAFRDVSGLSFRKR